jgi:hypothetical protein
MAELASSAGLARSASRTSLVWTAFQDDELREPPPERRGLGSAPGCLAIVLFSASIARWISVRAISRRRATTSSAKVVATRAAPLAVVPFRGEIDQVRQALRLDLHSVP